MRVTVNLLESIKEAAEAIEQAASGMLAPTKMHIEADLEDDGKDYKVVLSREGSYGQWEIDVEEVVPVPPTPPPTPRKRTTKAAKKTTA